MKSTIEKKFQTLLESSLKQLENIDMGEKYSWNEVINSVANTLDIPTNRCVKTT